MPIRIRPLRVGDGPILQDIERLAGQRFADFGMPSIAEDEPMSVDVLDGYAVAGRGWVAVDAVDDSTGGTGEPVGYAVVDVVDGCAHIEQISVRPDAQGKGVGRAMVDEVRRWAAATGRPAVTLTTFTHVPWNRPLYEHLGFRVLSENEIPPELAAVRAAEAAHGIDPATRVCMRLDLGA